MQPKKHHAWRWLGQKLLYVAGKRTIDGKGDRYHYTPHQEGALLMSENECKQFCKYMHDCNTVGFCA